MSLAQCMLTLKKLCDFKSHFNLVTFKELYTVSEDFVTFLNLPPSSYVPPLAFSVFFFTLYLFNMHDFIFNRIESLRVVEYLKQIYSINYYTCTSIYLFLICLARLITINTCNNISYSDSSMTLFLPLLNCLILILSTALI